MIEFSEVHCQAGAFRPRVRSSARVTVEPALIAAPRNLPLKDSIFAFGFLTFYLTAYLAAGFAGIRAVGWFWTAIFG